MPELKKNVVVQIALGKKQAVLDAKLSPVKYEVEKVIGKQIKHMKEQYLVVWKDYPGADSWEYKDVLGECGQAIAAFENGQKPLDCRKLGDEVCSCGDTGCDGPAVPKYDISCSSTAALQEIAEPVPVDVVATSHTRSEIVPTEGRVRRKQALKAKIDSKSQQSKSLHAQIATEPNEIKADLSFFVPLMDMCRLNTPLLKRIPNSQRSAFATLWGRLLDEAVASKHVSKWCEFFMLPKCVLWSPARGGKRLAKKVSMANMVGSRLAKWNTDRKSLWAEVVERSKSKSLQEKPPAQPNVRLEESVVGALRMGDVRKALQMLNSAPIAAKTAETLARLRKLHPKGENPAPIVPQEVPRMTQEVVSKALSSFGPGSAAGLMGYKPFLVATVHAR